MNSSILSATSLREGNAEFKQDQEMDGIQQTIPIQNMQYV